GSGTGKACTVATAPTVCTGTGYIAECNATTLRCKCSDHYTPKNDKCEAVATAPGKECTVATASTVCTATGYIAECDATTLRCKCSDNYSLKNDKCERKFISNIS
ncbi:unnamed protein product, partial [Lymnaea stagnalis]